MKMSTSAETPGAYVRALTGWRKTLVQGLRKAVLATGKLEERIKWGHLVYFANGPVLLIRAEEHRVLFGFWRGQRLTNLDERLKPGGKYEMATITFSEGGEIGKSAARQLAAAAIVLNRELGDPTAVAKRR